MASSSEECSSSGSATSLDGPSPYAIRHEDRPYWYHSAPNSKTTTTTPVTFGVHNGGGPGIPLAGATSPFLSHPLISPKFGRRTINASLNGCNALGGGTKLQRGFSDPVVRRKRSLCKYLLINYY
ncbi:unnamed protein product [Anisakis simplex]|uniref:Uncharacterized protein n=1 Tax=Anisakis simplex TaxID=6269 RepID=A0A0M3JNM7_ANISI|nr:unnamed protein product [Anisakis simplex]